MINAALIFLMLCQMVALGYLVIKCWPKQK
jgi:hypothetical protein